MVGGLVASIIAFAVGAVLDFAVTVRGQVANCHGRYRAGVLFWFRPSPAQDSTLDSPAPVTSMLGVARPDEFGMRIIWPVSSGTQWLERKVIGHTTLTGDRLSSP
jgi:hypothetical protein